MARVTVNGLSLGYELIGDEGPAWVLTPGGRFSKDKPGIREMATDLAALGNRVLIWDRPNCGESDVCFEGESESILQADCLAGLLRELELGPTVLLGGSAGARVSLLTAYRDPDVARAMALWWITGGIGGYVVNAGYYCGDQIKAAWTFGMEGVADLPQWQEQLERNPSNRERILSQDRDTFIATMERWMRVHIASEKEVVAGLTAEQAKTLMLPAAVVRSHSLDWVHPTWVTDRVAEVLPSCTMLEWPWPDDGELEREAYRVGSSPLFTRWRALALTLDEWAKRSVF